MKFFYSKNVLIFIVTFVVFTIFFKSYFNVQQRNEVEQTSVKITGLNEHIKIKVYGTNWCPYCEKTKKLLVQKKLPFIFIDVENDASGHEEFEKLRGDKYPLIIIGNILIRGINVPAIENQLTQQKL